MSTSDGPRVAVCGAGYWGKNLVRNFHELGALALVCDPSRAIRDMVEERHPGVRTTASFDEALEGDDIDAVVLATPAETHHALAKRALLAGKDAFVEKPLALTVADGEDLVRTAEDHGRILMVGHILDYHPAVEALLELIGDGELGKVQYVYSNRLNLGKVRREENVIWSFAPHDISLINAITGALPERVAASGGSYLQPHIADATVTQLAYPGGVRAHIFVSWLHPVKEQRLVVVGSKGMAVFDDRQPAEDKLVVYEHAIEWIDHQPVPKRADGRSVAIADAEPMRAECQDFLDRIRDREAPRSDGTNGLRVLRVLAAAQASLEQGGAPVDPRSPSARPAAARGWWAHPTASVDEGATLGRGSKVWHHAHVMGKAVVGEGCVLGQNVFVANNVTLGDNVKVQNNVSVYEGVTLADDVFCGPSMVFTNDPTPRSDVRKGPEGWLPTPVGRGATLGAICTIVCGNAIGAHAFVGAGAVVTRDVPAYGLVFGVPARLKGFRCACGEANLPFSSTSEGTEAGVACPACDAAYDRDGADVRPTR